MQQKYFDYQSLFLNDTPLIDLRAPIEFNKGAFPYASNLPLMNDDERQQVGTCYKQNGQDAAIILGHQLVSGVEKKKRIEAWVDFMQTNPNAYLYCFRGGLRSQTVQKWLKIETGIDYPRVIGGYKAMRQYLIDYIEDSVKSCHFLKLGGLTGTGKTEILAQLTNSIDLEKHANHRGSSFGKQPTRQPLQIDFENNLAIDFLKKRAMGHTQFILENESRTIGHCAIPLSLHKQMQTFPLIWLEDHLENRINRILNDYVITLSADFVTHYGEEQGWQIFEQQLCESLSKLSKRLGGARYESFSKIMRAALFAQKHHGDFDLHREWITRLLVEYYDPMYTFAHSKNPQQIVFKGNRKDILEYFL